MALQIPLDSELRADDPKWDDIRDDGTHEVAPDLAYQRLGIVNVAYVGKPDAGDRGWVLVDAGIFGTAKLIRLAAERRFGDGARPAAIVLTHGHFDHVGVLETLAADWEVPVVAHELERPYLTGEASYPPPDPSVGGGLVARLSPLFPRSPVNVADRVVLLPGDGSVPYLPGWRWVHTPGHTPGHVSFWRDSDRSLIVGDAFITTGQESAYEVAVQEPEMHGPPAYFTIDWQASRQSVEKLAALEPETIIPGHGRPMAGAGMRQALGTLAREFDRVAVPREGRYVKQPAKAEDGSAYREA
jgi:glyoxylase-like metal-dependent hydrolase (beta-lactamase superfamily II)